MIINTWVLVEHNIVNIVVQRINAVGGQGCVVEHNIVNIDNHILDTIVNIDNHILDTIDIVVQRINAVGCQGLVVNILNQN